MTVARLVFVALLALVHAVELAAQAGPWAPPAADTARALSLLSRAAAVLRTRPATDTASVLLRDQVAFAFLRAGAPDSPRALTRTRRVLHAAACVAVHRSDTASAVAIVGGFTPGEGRDWAFVQLAERILGYWWTTLPPPAARARAAAVVAKVADPTPRASGTLTLAQVGLRAGETAEARRWLALADTLVAVSNDELRRPGLEGDLARAWADLGDVRRALTITAASHPGAQAYRIAWIAYERAMHHDMLAADSLFPKARAFGAQVRDSAAPARVIDIVSGLERQTQAARHPRVDAATGTPAVAVTAVARPQLAATLADSARAAFLAHDTTIAFALLARMPDPEAIGYRAAGYANLALIAQHRSDPTYWPLERAAMRHARLEAVRVRSPRLKGHILRGILGHLLFYGLSDDTRRTPELRALQDSIVWDADSTAELMPAPARTAEWVGIASAWAHRAHVREALAVLGRLPARAARDSAAARIFSTIVFAVPGVVALSDSLGLPSDTLPATTRAMWAARAVLLLNHGDTSTARPFWTAALGSPPSRGGDTLTVTRAIYSAVRGPDVAAAEDWALRASDPLSRLTRSATWRMRCARTARDTRGTSTVACAASGDGPQHRPALPPSLTLRDAGTRPAADTSGSGEPRFRGVQLVARQRRSPQPRRNPAVVPRPREFPS